MTWKNIKTIVVCVSVAIFVVSSFNPPDMIGLPFHFVFGFAASFLLLLLVYLGVVCAPDDDDSWEED